MEIEHSASINEKSDKVVKENEETNENKRKRNREYQRAWRQRKNDLKKKVAKEDKEEAKRKRHRENQRAYYQRKKGLKNNDKNVEKEEAKRKRHRENQRAYYQRTKRLKKKVEELLSQKKLDKLQMLNKGPKTSEESGQKLIAQKALLKQLKQQQESDAKVRTATEDIRRAWPSEDNQVPGLYEIRIIETRTKSADASQRWRERNKSVRRSSKKKKKQAKTGAERMREYRQRKKLKKYDMGKVIDPTLPVECRACLEKFNDGGELLDLFQPWATSWDGMGETIAQDLAQIANVDISRTDEFSKLICQYCYQKLLEACCFVANVRVRDRMLRQQVETPNNDSAWPKPIQVNEIIKKDILNTPMEIGIKQEVPDEEAYTTSVEKTTKEVEDSECFKTYSYVEVKVEPENIASPPIYSDNESTTQDELEDNSNAIFINHKSIKVEREYDATSENIQAVAMSLKKEFDDDESAECGDFNPCARILEETQSDLNPSTQTTRRLDMTETNSDQNASTSGAVPRRGDKKAAERSRLYRKRHKEENNQRRRDIRHQIQNAQIPSTDEIDQIIQTSPNQLRSNSHTRRQQRYYERHKDEINKRKRDKRQQQSVKSVPATTAERNKKYRERNKQIINERRRDSRQRLKLSCEYFEQFNSDYIQHPLLNPNYS